MTKSLWFIIYGVSVIAIGLWFERYVRRLSETCLSLWDYGSATNSIGFETAILQHGHIKHLILLRCLTGFRLFELS